jgi:hypothetical protein
MNYRVMLHNDEYYVIENSTDYIIKIFKNKKKAIKFFQFLENGGAFNGFTPKFLTL